MKRFSVLLFLAWSLAFSALAGNSSTKREKLDPEAYFKKWLTEEVVYIITDEEKDVFVKLKTVEEKERFIEQFWRRRAPDPSTPENEFKEEHYRRIQYANDHFSSGKPGWMTDRGKIYIKFGKPTEIASQPEGGRYRRAIHEGGGQTATYPFEVWRYKHIPGIGDDIEIEFVDPTQSGEYRIARDAMEKDALLYIGNEGLTLSELAGETTKTDRIRNRHITNWGERDSSLYYGMRSKDMPLTKLYLEKQLQRPPQIKFKDLETAVITKISYAMLPFNARSDYIYVSEDKVLALATIELDTKNLQYESSGDSALSKVEVYGEVQNLNRDKVYVFEDTITHERQPTQSAAALAVYQRAMLLKPGRYGLKLAVKDTKSGHLGTLDRLLLVPKYTPDKLSTSTLILAEKISPIRAGDSVADPFVLGQWKVIPSLRTTFRSTDYLRSYFEVYNFGVDQSTLKPKLEIKYQIYKGKDVEAFGRVRSSWFQENRLLVAEEIPLAILSPGQYQIQYEITDKIKSETTTTTKESFTVAQK